MAIVTISTFECAGIDGVVFQLRHIPATSSGIRREGNHMVWREEMTVEIKASTSRLNKAGSVDAYASRVEALTEASASAARRDVAGIVNETPIEGVDEGALYDESVPLKKKIASKLWQ